MKQFHKIILFIFSLMIAMISMEIVSAAELTTSFSGYYWDRKSENYHGSGSFRYYYLDGIDSYCLDPDSHEGGPLNLSDWQDTGISNDVKEKVLLVAYYGYNYPGHQTLKYRAATQALIWETIKGGDTKVTFFTERFGEGEELDISNERKEIERLISMHYVVPSFNNQVFYAMVGEPIVLTDDNNILNNFKVNINEATFYVQNNNLYLTPYKAGDLNVKLTKKETYTSNYKIFVSDEYQDQIIPGIIDTINGNVIIRTSYGKISIQKKDAENIIKQGDATLEGAKYGVYRSSNDILMTTIVTDENGIAESDNVLSYGNYYLKEIENSKGYKLDNNKYYFDINSQNNDVYLEVNEEVIKGKIKVIKQDSETKSCNSLGKASLIGAKYQVIDSSDNVVDVITIENDCIGYSKDLPYGTYKVKEIENSNGYNLDGNIYDVNIDTDNSEVNVISNEEVIKSKIKIIKQDSETKSCNSLGKASLIGAKYQVIDSSDNVVDVITIGNDCIGYSKDLPYGTYKAKEIESSMGYNLDENTYNVNINTDNLEVNIVSNEEVIKSKIKVIKQDSETKSCNSLGKASLIGAKYQVIDSNDNVVDVITIGNDCIGYSKDLPYGTYKVKEIENSKGYNLDENIYNVNIDTDTLEVNVISNEEVIKNYISILKQYDYVDGNSMFVSAEENVIFEIYDNENKKYSEIMTDKNGYASIYLPYGTWTFHQKTVIDGYQKIYDFNVVVDENSKKEQYYNILNNKLSAYVKLIKKDSETGNIIQLSGVQFKILNMDTNSYVSQYVGGKLLDTFETDENGIMTTYLKLEAGNYKIIEISTPSGYLINENGVLFSIGDDTDYSYDFYGPFVTIEYINDPIYGQIEIKKQGETFNIKDGRYYYDKMPLSSVKFNIYASEDIKSSDGNYIYYKKDTIVDKLVTDENGYAISKKLPLGKYYLVETKTNSAYVLNKEKYYFELKEVNNYTPIVYETYSNLNYLRNGSLEITKKDLYSGKVIPNTKIEVYTENNELIYQGSSDINGKIILNDLPIGKYYIVEVKASNGYKLNSEKISFEIKRNNQKVKIDLKNKKVKSIVKIHKVDENDNALEGVNINIYDEEDKIIYEGITDKNGMIEVELSYGKYYYKEISTIDNYIINEEKVYFDIMEDNKIFEFKLVNMKKEIEVPNTSCNNKSLFIPNIFIFIGILLNIYGKQKEII